VVAVTSTQAVKGGNITVKWSGSTSPTSTDWVGIYAVGSNDFAYLDWAYTNGGASGTVNVTLNHPNIVAGNTYEARLYANDGYTLIARTPPFTVVANTGQSTPAALYYVHNDHLGTPQALTNQAGAVVWRAMYDPFGQATVTLNSITNNLRLAGMYSDSETGLYYWGSRYYDPKTGRSIQPDRMSVAAHVRRWRANMRSPYRLPLEINPYVYVANNPLKWIDRFGFEAMWGGDPFLNESDVSPPPPPPYDNGNYSPGFEDQDNICSPAPWNPIEYLPCAKKCCRAHDACYAKYGCNASSWRGNFTANYGNPCQICNIEVMQCVVSNISNFDCSDEPCTK
jgi:RHS repeat-associated protein